MVMVMMVMVLMVLMGMVKLPPLLMNIRRHYSREKSNRLWHLTTMRPTNG